MTPAHAGLSTSQAAEALARDGRNELPRKPPRSKWWRLLEQLRSPLILILVVAAVVSAALGDVAEALAIIFIVVLNALVGFFQESRAEAAVFALRSLTAPRARVVRDGEVVLLPAAEVVVGDVLCLEAGDLVAADGTLFEATHLSTTEAALTGESESVDKGLAPVPADTPLADRTNQVFLGTTVAGGTGRARVHATGARTELGHIATLLDSVELEETPLQHQLARVGKGLLWLCLAIVAVVAALGLWRGLPWLEVLISSVSLAVAAVPEGLPAIVTIALALGVQRMAKQHVLVRRLPAVETLGSTTVIATDKTGTLTLGHMQVREVFGDAHEVLRVAVACCDAELDAAGASVGDPTEVALLVAGRAKGLERAAVEQAAPRTGGQPFDSERKRMSVLRADGTLYVKGAVDLLLPLCTHVLPGVVAANQQMATRGLRVLALATGTSEAEAGLTLVGLVGLADPPRPEAIVAIAAARAAGIRVVMMTGDHPVTAEAIAREMGLLLPGESPEGRVFARVTPEDKLRIVQRLKAQGEIVAVTGDGTNDAPALKQAHVGIAMGLAGVEVTREAADLVLADDNFGSIVAAVQEGRGIYDNIRKALVYLLAGNSAELAVTLTASLLGLPLPLLPLQLLWMNLVTDGLPALALVMDPALEASLLRPPRPPSEPILGRAQWLRIVGSGVVMTAVTLFVFTHELSGDTLLHARTAAFSTLVFSQVLGVFAFRSLTQAAPQVGFFTNPRLLAIVALSVLLQVGLMAWPVTAALFQLGPFSWAVVGWSLGLGLVPVTLIEISKPVRARA